jgi:HEAT repeat protein
MSFEEGHEHAGIVEDLVDGDEEIRRLAVERLSSLPARDAIPRLVESLGDISWRVRKAAVERLVGSMEPASVADALVLALADGENPGRRNSAVEGLLACGSWVVPRLIEALATDDSDVRKLIVDAMAGIGDDRARDALIETLSDRDPNVRAAAADALGVMGGDAAAAALRRVAIGPDEDQLVRFSALRALGRLECSVSAEDLEGVLADPVLRPAGFILLGRCDDDAAEAMLLKGLGLSARVSREAAMEALLARLGRVGPDAADGLARRIRETVAATEGLVEAAIERMTEADLATRLMLVQFLGLVGSAECVVPILESGRDEAIAEVALATLEALGQVTEEALDRAWPGLDRELRRNACVLLGRTRATGGSSRLAEALDDPDAELRTAAAGALGARRSQASLPDLVRRLETAALDEEPESEDELEALIDALVELTGPGAEHGVSQLVDQLAARLGSSSDSVRRAAASVLARVCRPADADRVTPLLKDPSASVRRRAVGGLIRLDPDTAAEPLRLALADEAPQVRMAAAAALGASSSSEVLADLERLLADEEPRVCAAALRAIGSYCAEARCQGEAERARALAFLASPRVQEGRGGMLAMAALEALEAIGGPEAGSVAVMALDSPEPEVVQAAVNCIGRHGESEALSELIPAVQHPSWAVRGEAIQTLAERRVVRALPAILRRLETEQDSFVRDVIMRALRRLEE